MTRTQLKMDIHCLTLQNRWLNQDLKALTWQAYQIRKLKALVQTNKEKVNNLKKRLEAL